MNTFDPGDSICLKGRFSAEMMLIGEIDGAVTDFRQDAIGEATIEDHPTSFLEAISIDESQLPAYLRRIADSLRRSRAGKSRFKIAN